MECCGLFRHLSKHIIPFGVGQIAGEGQYFFIFYVYVDMPFVRLVAENHLLAP